MQLTYNQILKRLQAIGNAHAFINKVTKGGVGDIDLKKKSIYPLMHIAPLPVNIGSGSVTFSFEITVADIIDDGVGNDLLNQEDEVHSDTLQTIHDIVSEFNYGETVEDAAFDNYEIELPVNAIPFSNVFGHGLSGWTATIDVETINSLDACDFPNKEIDICGNEYSTDYSSDYCREDPLLVTEDYDADYSIDYR